MSQPEHEEEIEICPEDVYEYDVRPFLRIRYTPTGTYHTDYRLYAPVTTNMSDA